jgi:hypothetical protein
MLDYVCTWLDGHDGMRVSCFWKKCSSMVMNTTVANPKLQPRTRFALFFCFCRPCYCTRASANRNISFQRPKRRVLISGWLIYKNAMAGPHDLLNPCCFFILFHFWSPTYKNHNISNFNPNLMGFFALASSWSLLFYHIFSRILWSMDFNWC